MRLKKGIVTSCKMNKTIVVSVDSHISHPKYKKRFKVTTKFYTHDEENKFRKDEIKESLNPEKALLNAPEKEDGMFIVPKVVGEN